MIDSSYIIGSAVYETMLELLKDEEYCTYINDYVYVLGLERYDYVPTDDNIEEDKMLLSLNPNICPFLYNGDFDEIVSLYNRANINKYRYLGVWNIIPKDIEVKGDIHTFDTEIDFVLPVRREWTTEQRIKYAFNPILERFKEVFMKKLLSYPYVVRGSYGLNHKVFKAYNYAGILNDEIGDYVSILRITFDLPIRESACLSHYETAKANYNRLLTLISL